MSSRSLCVVSVASGLHYACCWATSFESYNITTSIHEILVLPLFPLVAFLPLGDPAAFYMLMIANSVLWGLSVYSIAYAVLSAAQGEFRDWITRISQRHGKFSLLFLDRTGVWVDVDPSEVRKSRGRSPTIDGDARSTSCGHAWRFGGLDCR